MRRLQLLRHLFRPRHRTQQVFAGDLGEIRIAPAAARKFDEQRRILVDTFETGRCDRNAVEVRAEADVIYARDLADVIDVIGDIGDRDGRRRMPGIPFRQRRARAIGLAKVKTGW